jgi:4-hydroxy-tetrahydrodipicolinate reductase
MKIGVAGINGRMGRLVADEIVAAGHDLAGGTSLGRHPPDTAKLFTDIGALARACDVVVDFTHADAAPHHAASLREAKIAWVLGTTGLSESATEAVRRAALGITVVQAANFSPGVNLVLALAERLARALPAEQYDAEIMEMHHRQKVDAPSGTALALGRAVAAGRGVTLDSVAVSGRDGQTGARPEGAIGFAALRGGQVVGEHTLLFAAAGEHIALKHTALDRRVFARGAVRAALWTAGREPGLFSMIDVLGINESL